MAVVSDSVCIPRLNTSQPVYLTTALNSVSPAQVSIAKSDVGSLLQHSCRDLGCVLARNGTLRFNVGFARKGWKVADSEAFVNGLRELLRGTKAVAEVLCLRRTGG